MGHSSLHPPPIFLAGFTQRTILGHDISIRLPQKWVTCKILPHFRLNSEVRETTKQEPFAT